MGPLFVLSHVANGDGYTIGTLGVFRSQEGAQKAAAELAEDWANTETGTFDSGSDWEEIDGDDWGRQMLRRPLFRRVEVGAVEIIQFDEIGD